MQERKTVTLALSGASGAQYGLRLLECLIKTSCEVHLLVSSAARVVINTETQYSIAEDFGAQKTFFQEFSQASEGQLNFYSKEDWFSPVASGSGAPSSMVICPCSGGSLSAIASGASNNLIERAADVALKERRQLILVPRETPYSEIHLENMLKLSRMGAVVLPASPGFYQRPQSVEDLIDFVVARILDHLELPHELLKPWGRDAKQTD